MNTWFRFPIHFESDERFTRLRAACGGREDRALSILVKAMALGYRGVEDEGTMTRLLGGHATTMLVACGYHDPTMTPPWGWHALLKRNDTKGSHTSRIDKKRVEESRREEKREDKTPPADASGALASEKAPRKKIAKGGIQYSVRTAFPSGEEQWLKLRTDFANLPDFDLALTELHTEFCGTYPDGLRFMTLAAKVRARLGKLLEQFNGRWGRYHPSRFSDEAIAEAKAQHDRLSWVAAKTAHPEDERATMKEYWRLLGKDVSGTNGDMELDHHLGVWHYDSGECAKCTAWIAAGKIRNDAPKPKIEITPESEAAISKMFV